MPVPASADPSSSPLELEIRRHAATGRWDDATTAAILGYGPELLGFLQAATSSRAEAEELYAELCERLWRKLPEFGWRSSFRTWAYIVARRIAYDRRRHLELRQRREVALGDIPSAAIAAAVRSTIESTPAREDERMQLVRSLLDEEERTLLVLRIERRMRWPEIARILGDSDDEPRIAREAARLRKQFERIKVRLREGVRGKQP